MSERRPLNYKRVERNNDAESSPSKNTEIRRTGSRKSRDSGAEDRIHGIHPIKEALDAGANLERLLVKKGTDNSIREIVKQAHKAGIPVQEVPLEKLNRVTRKNHQGAIAFLSPITYSDLNYVVMETFEQGRDPLILVLDQVTDIGNFGAICRTAECCGVDAVVVPMKGRAQINAQAVKSSAGALLNIAVCREPSLEQSLKYLKECGLKVIGCTEKTENTIYQADLKGPIAVVMGGEENGISKRLLDSTDQMVSIPMVGKTASLNVSVATGVVLFETLKQRG